MASFSTPAGAPPSKTLYGARSVFSIQGVLVGYATSVSWQNSYNYAPLNVLGNIEVIQHLPMTYTVTLTGNQFRLVGTTLRSYGWWPRIGSTGQEHLQNLVGIPELSATIEDIQTATIIAQFEGLRIESSSISVSSGNIMAEDFTAVVRRMKMEDEA